MKNFWGALGVFTFLCRVIQRSGNPPSEFSEVLMKADQLRQPIFCIAVVLLSLGCFAPSIVAQTSFAYQKIKVDYRPVEVRRADGSVFTAEFLAEFVLFSDGRADGGFGMWELSGPDVLSLYRVTEGRNNGPFWSFKASRLAAEPVDALTINARAGGGSAPAGTVTFIIDGSNGLHLTFNVRAEISDGCSGGRCTDPLPQFGLVRAGPQTVQVETFTGNYTASFENTALVLSGGSAIGSLTLSSPTGSLQKVRIKGGEIEFRNGQAQIAWLRGQTTNQSADPLPVLMVIANQDGPTEPWRIYDIAGTQVPAHFEAQGRITAIAVDP
jgi:hypothetical protein